MLNTTDHFPKQNWGRLENVQHTFWWRSCDMSPFLKKGKDYAGSD